MLLLRFLKFEVELCTFAKMCVQEAGIAFVHGVSLLASSVLLSIHDTQVATSRWCEDVGFSYCSLLPPPVGRHYKEAVE